MEKRFTLVFGIILIASFLLYAQQEVRTYDGSNNNLQNPSWGATHTQLRRMVAPDYADGIAAPGGVNRPNPRIISNQLFAQGERVIDDRMELSDFVWVFGQFMDHDISLSDPNDEPAMIPVDFPDPHFNPGGRIPNMVIPMNRTKVMEGTGTDPSNPREHFNEITSWLDASSVYGSGAFRANWLRSGIDGKLKVSKGNLLPYNTVTGEYEDEIDIDAPPMGDDVGNAPKLFVAGDPRANENALLASMHTIFVREHNRLCDEYIALHPDWSDEQIYQKVRKIIGGIIQAITYEEWLPTMGVYLPPYAGYDASVNPTVTNVFSAAAFRIGHTLLSSNIMMVDADGQPHPEGDLTLRDVFFNIDVVAQHGIDPFFKGMGIQMQQNRDAKVIDDVRNFLFGPPGAGGLDLVSININRARERGIPDFNSVRVAFGLEPYNDFQSIVNDEEVAGILEELYGDVNDIDPWVGMLAEQELEGQLFGQTVTTILQHQFGVLRDGDRFYYENDPDLTAEEKERIKNTTFSDIIKRCTQITLMQENVFEATQHQAICGYFGEETALWGNVMTRSNNRVSDIELTLTMENATTPVRYESINSAFSLENVPTCEDVTIQLSKEDNYREGVTTLDMILILRHILGIVPFDSPYQYIAADANNSSSVTTADLVAIRRVLLGIDDAFPNNASWRFIDAAYAFNNPNNPLAEDFPESIVAQLTGADVAGQDFVAVKVGDVNDSAAQSLNGIESASRNNNQLTLLTKDMDLVAGNTYTIPIQALGEATLSGFQLNLRYIHSTLEFIRANSLLLEPENVRQTDGMIAAIYYGPQHIQAEDFSFELTFLAKRNARLSDVLNVSNHSDFSEAYNERLERMDLDLQFTADPLLQVGQNQPNPFTGWTKVGFELPVAGFVDFEVTDLTGKSLYSTNQQYDAGYNEIIIRESDIAATGVLYYRLQMGTESVTKKMIVLD